MYLDPIQPKNVSMQGNSASTEKTEQAKPVVFEAKTEKTDLPEPQFVTQYGKTKLPEGSVLEGERVVYESEKIFNPSTGKFWGDWYDKDVQFLCGMVTLPNGIKVVIVKDGTKGDISISEDGTTTFKNVEFTTIIGTDGDDKIVFDGDLSTHYDHHGGEYISRTINTRYGNDEVKNPGLWADFGKYFAETTVNSDENLKVSGWVFNTTLNVVGNLDTKNVTDGTALKKGSVEKKK